MGICAIFVDGEDGFKRRETEMKWRKKREKAGGDRVGLAPYQALPIVR